MSTPDLDQTSIPFQVLVGDCWALLKGTVSATFPTTTPAHPSRFVILQPSGSRWMGEFWQDLVVPTLTALLANPPTATGGWSTPMGRNLVEATFRSSLTGTRWYPFVNFSA